MVSAFTRMYALRHSLINPELEIFKDIAANAVKKLIEKLNGELDPRHKELKGLSRA
jgi:hypothetical protein